MIVQVGESVTSRSKHVFCVYKQSFLQLTQKPGDHNGRDVKEQEEVTS